MIMRGSGVAGVQEFRSSEDGFRSETPEFAGGEAFEQNHGPMGPLLCPMRPISPIRSQCRGLLAS
jgi:hypothetical protein